MNAIAAALSPMTPPSPGAQSARGDESRSADFARCLDRACEGDAAEPDADEASKTRQRPAVKARRDRDAAAARQTEAGAAKPVTPEKTNAGGDATVEPETAVTEAAQAPRDAAAAPDLAALLPGWSAPPGVVASAAPGAAAADVTETLQAATSGAIPASPTLRNDTMARAAAPLETTPPRGASTASSDSAPSNTASPAAQLQAAASEPKEAAPGLPAAAPTIAPTAAFATPSATMAVKAPEAAPPTATVPAAVGTPAFAPSLATQVRWWANDGVQQAQLLLNPAEMGPVTVKIALAGREARIDFSADLAATRSAIEAALPALAAALDDSGLKLCGGGVHDGAAQRQPAWGERSVTHRTLKDEVARDDGRGANSAATRGSPGRGLVDLVA